LTFNINILIYKIEHHENTTKFAFATGLDYCIPVSQRIRYSKSDKRTEIMNTIANDEMMSKEMMGVLMNNKSSKMMMKHDAGDNENDKGILK
jgi:hypothetical protein